MALNGLRVHRAHSHYAILLSINGKFTLIELAVVILKILALPLKTSKETGFKSLVMRLFLDMTTSFPTACHSSVCLFYARHMRCVGMQFLLLTPVQLVCHII